MPLKRVVLGQIDGNRQRNTKLTPRKRGKIIGAYKLSHRNFKIAYTLGYLESTIRYTL